VTAIEHEPAVHRRTAAAPAVEVRNVSKRYETRRRQVLALDSIDFAVAEHEFVTVVGPSGCGKSTVLKLIAGVSKPTTGEVLQFGRLVTKPTPDVGMVFQTPVLMKWRTILDNVLFPVEMLGLSRRDHMERARELLAFVGLGDFMKSYPRELSGGMQQRAALCRALVHDPPLLLMDEPFGALDALTRDLMNVELMRIWNEARKSTLLITHSIAEAVFLADRVLVMSPRPGRILAEVAIDLPRPRHPEIRLTEPFLAKVREIAAHLGAVGG
jgi:NitT/TauT family transport system ATP-binding protein